MSFGFEVLRAILEQLRGDLSDCSCWDDRGRHTGPAVMIESNLARYVTDVCSYTMVVAGDELVISWGMTTHRLDLLRHDGIAEFVAGDLRRWKSWANG